MTKSAFLCRQLGILYHLVPRRKKVLDILGTPLHDHNAHLQLEYTADRSPVHECHRSNAQSGTTAIQLQLFSGQTRGYRQHSVLAYIYESNCLIPHNVIYIVPHSHV